MQKRQSEYDETPAMGVARVSDVHQTDMKGDVMNPSTPVAFGDAVSMTSLDIAELVESRHSVVKRSISRLIKKGVIRETPMAFSEEINNLGFKTTREHYIFEGDRGRRDSIIVVAQLCPEFTARLVDRWQELENRASSFQIPQTMADALRLAADQHEKIERQRLEIIQSAPKVAFADQVEVAPDAITVGEAAKTIGTGRTRLMAFLRHNGWVNRRNEPYQAKIESGWLDVKISQWEHPEHGLKEQITTLVTGKGLVRLQKLWSESTGNAA